MIYPDSKTILEVHGLCASVEGTPILKNMNFTIKSGEIHAIMGQNGSGKSTFSKATYLSILLRRNCVLSEFQSAPLKVH